MQEWAAIVERYGPLVWRTVELLLESEADGTDAFQETFLAALKLAKREEVRNWEAALRHLATARAIDVLRRRMRERRRVVQGEAWMEVAGREAGPSEAAEERELVECLRLAVAELPARQAEAYCLQILQGWTYEQIGGQMGLSVNAVGVLLNRARGTLTEVIGMRMKKEVDDGKR